MNLADQVFAALVDWPKCAICCRAYRPRHKRHSTVGLPWRLSLIRGDRNKTFPHLCLECNRAFVTCGVCKTQTLARHMWTIRLAAPYHHPAESAPVYFCKGCSHVNWQLMQPGDVLYNQPLRGGNQLGRP